MAGESWASSPAVRRAMQSNRHRDTSPELAVRRLVHASGLRYLVDARPVAGLNRRADMVFRGARVAVFIDGCFWHGCPMHHTVAKANASYWADKVAANRARDLDTNQRLEQQGWTVRRFWEHENSAEVAAATVNAVRNSGGGRRGRAAVH